MNQSFVSHLSSELDELKTAGLYKSERIIDSTQAGTVSLDSGRTVINPVSYTHLTLPTIYSV